MSVDVGAIKKVFEARIFSRALQLFDKSTMVIVLSCWGGAILLMLFALYTLNLSVEAKRQVIEAAAIEPGLPQIIMRPAEKAEIDPIIERLEKRFQGINFTVSPDRNITISASDGTRFRTWLGLLSYVETISPQFRWQIKELCVGGKCPGGTPMTATLAAEKVTFSTQIRK